MHDPERDIRDIPLSRLELSPANVRKTPAGASAFTELKASIAAHGLLENLIARSMGPSPDGAGRYAVIAGGRRLAAMQALAAEGALDEDHPVPCRMIGSIVAAEEVSLAENSVRAAMHPADQVEAFRRLADAGSTAGAIAARFGVSERTVEKRLRLGNAAPVLLEAYRAGEIDLDTLMAFAVTTDQARQNAVWETVSQQGYRLGAWQVKRLLTEDRVPATSAIARFVGIEDYEAAGGRIDRDLFAEEDERGIWFDDPDLLNKLAIDSLQVAARELETRWKWAEARLDMDWSATAAFGRVRPQPTEPTDEEKAETERLRTRNDELANMDDDGWTEELVEEADANETRLDEIEATIEARAVYRREDIAIAGCIATIGNDGELKLIQALVRPENMPAHASEDADAAGQDDTGDGESASSGIEAPTFVAPLASPGDAEAEARKEVGVGIGLADDLRAIRTAIVKSQLACDFEAAFDLLLFQLARSVFTNGYHDDALDIRAAETPDRPAMRVNDDAFGNINVGEKHLEIDRAGQKLDWAGLPDDEAFAELRALPQQDKRTLFASCVARTLKGQLAFEPKARPEVEATVARLDIDFAAAVRGNRDQVWTADLLWSRLRKDRILAVARETLGETWAQAEAKQKKAEIAKAMQEAFAHGDDVPAGVTAEGRAAAIAWTPPGFRAFDIAGRRRQAVVAQKHLDDADVDAALEQMGSKAVPERVHGDALGQPRRLGCRAAGRVQDLHVDRLALVAAGKQPLSRPGQTPVGAQDRQQLRRQHDGPVLRSLAVAHLDQHPAAVDIRHLEAHRLRGAKARRIGRRQCGAGLQGRHRLEKAHNLVRAQDHRQFPGLSGIGDPLRYLGPVQRDPVEEPERANRLIERRPGYLLRHQENLEGTDILDIQAIRRTAKIAAELGHRMKVGSLRGRRQIAHRHVFDHAAAQGAHSWARGGHGRSPDQGLSFDTRNPSIRRPNPPPTSHPSRVSGFVQSVAALRRNAHR